MAHLGAAADGPADSRASRIGVFVCHCGGNISDVVDVKRVAAEAARMPGVVLATAHTFMCSDPGQALIEEKIRELELNRVVVAACSPTLHQMTFRRTIDARRPQPVPLRAREHPRAGVLGRRGPRGGDAKGHRA